MSCVPGATSKKAKQLPIPAGGEKSVPIAIYPMRQKTGSLLNLAVVSKVSGVYKDRKICICCIVYLFLGIVLHMPAQTVEEPRWFRLTDFSGALSFRYQLTDEEESTGEDVYRDITRRYFEGGLLLSTRGSIYHSNLLSFNANVNLVGHRTKNRYFSDPTVNNAINNTYNIHLFFLKKKKINFDFYTLRNFTTADRAFLERYFTTTKNTGMRMKTLTKWFPLEIAVYANNIKSESLTYSERNEKTKNADFRVELPGGPRTRSFLKTRFKDYNESVFDVQYRSWDLFTNFIHTYGIKDRNSITSTATYQRMSGFYDLETYNIRLDNTYYLKPKLFFNADYLLTGDNSFNRSFTRHNAYIRGNHQLFESLRSVVQVGGRLEDSSFRKNSTLLHHFGVYYNKKIPSGNISLNFINSNERGNYVSHQDVVETSEVRDFSLTDAIILTFPGIDSGSIRVTDADLSQVYIEGVDYQVDVVNNIVSITRFPGGAIPAGAKVTIFYRYLSYPDYRLKTHNYILNTRLEVLKYFYFIFSRSANHQTITSDYLLPPYEEYDRTVLGGGIHARFLKARYTYETYNSNLSDYVSRYLSLSGNVNLFRKLLLSANISLSHLDHEPGTFFSRFNAYSLECRLKLRHNISADALFRKMDYSTPQYVRNRESLLFKFRWDFRRIVLDVFYEHILTGHGLNERGHNFFSIMIRRVF